MFINQLLSIISITKIGNLDIRHKFFCKKMQEKAKKALFGWEEWAVFSFIFVILRHIFEFPRYEQYASCNKESANH
jgi:hypothetical protein